MMLSLLLYLLLTAPDCPDGLGQLGLSIVTRYPDSMMVREKHGWGGILSEDGSLYFGYAGAAKQPVYDMATGEYWYDEWIVVRKSKSRGWQFGTQSQWGHISMEGLSGFAHTSVMIAPSKALWVSVGGSNPETIVVSFILPETRGKAPNVNVSVPRLEVIPLFRRSLLWSGGTLGNYYFGRLTEEGSQYVIRAYLVIPGNRSAQLLPRPHYSGPVLPTIKGEQIRPTMFDPHSQRLYYGGVSVAIGDPARDFSVPAREWDAKAKVWRDLSLPRKRSVFYWRGNMLVEDKDTDELFLVSDDRKSLKLIGKYDWLAKSVSGEFCFVREIDTGDYLLLRTSD